MLLILNRTLVVMSTGGWEHLEWSRCTIVPFLDLQGVRRASYLDVPPEALSDGAQSRTSLGGGHGGRGSRRASVCMAAEALMAGMVARWLQPDF